MDILYITITFNALSDFILLLAWSEHAQSFVFQVL